MNYYDDIEVVTKLDISKWKHMIKLLSPYKKAIILSALIMLVSASVDVVLPLFTTYAIQNFIELNTEEGLFPFFMLFVGAILVQTVTVIAFTRFAMWVEMSFSRDLKQATFNHLQTLSFSYYNKTPVGYMLARVMSDTNKISAMIAWGFVDFLWSLTFVIGSLIAMAILSLKLAFLIMLVVPPIAVVTYYFQGKILKANRIVRSTNSKITADFNEGIGGARTSKTLVMEADNIEAFSGLTRAMKGAGEKASFHSAIFLPIVLFFSSIGTAVILYIGGEMVVDNLMDFAVLSAFITYSITIFEPVQQMARLFADFVAMQVNVERVTSLLNTKSTINDSEDVISKYGDNFTPKRENWEEINGEIEIKNVSFMYDDGKENVLTDFSLKVKEGTMVAIVGETGAGKSTLVNLICRFFEPNKGQILIDGIDYRERSQLWLHSNIGYVLQSPHLFSGTVADNIRYGKPTATDEEIEDAAKLVCADKVVERLEKGYDSFVGEGGDRLSTGEKQLISFARAIIANPAIFVLDEATSSVDTHTEQLIQQAISTVLKGRTSFIIAHRLSTIKQADIILVVEGGKIVEQGSHKELLRKKGAYYKLYTKQFETEMTDTLLSVKEGYEKDN